MHSNRHPLPGTYDARRAARQLRALDARRADRAATDRIRTTYAGLPASVAVRLAQVAP